MRLISFPNNGNDEIYMDCLMALAGDKRDSMVDLGCNLAPHTPKLGYKNRTYIDIMPRTLDWPEEQQYFIQADILDREVVPQHADAMFNLDVIEHLTKEDGYKLIGLMSASTQRPIFFTPLDPWMMTTDDDKNPESHRSVWRPEDLDEGWAGILFPNYHQNLGIGAWFFFREEYFDESVVPLLKKRWARQIAGVLMVYNGISMDYCVRESIESLKALCNHTFVVDCGSNDGTNELVASMVDEKMSLMSLPIGTWNLEKGRERLSVFTNIGISRAQELGYSWVCVAQADEVLHESCFQEVRNLMGMPYTGYIISRINLWGDSQHKLDVSQDRKPVSTEIIRLAHSYYRAVDDAESLANPYGPTSIGDGRSIRMYHMGFVRDKRVHSHKIKNMQANVFQMEHDSRIDSMMDWFDPWAMGFSKEDVIPIEEPLPAFVQEWASERDRINAEKPEQPNERAGR